ncbi:lamin tail domain-containing protein [Streptomyces sp. NBC_00669]|uniref:lamin tail domain-containing protein n=1 Tax=Streptomyces sp. NBC_00669 TaxID=2976011 RepID=UPI002E3500E0|nr:lamin tail domain-containing protein [Streptomyces sp. NBC_00669]
MPIGVAGAVVLAGIAVHSASATPSSDAVIAEVYGGGGNSGATYTNDFIELANAGASTLDLSGYSVQYLRGTPAATSTWRATPLTGTLVGGARYLVQEWANTGGSLPLPTPDATGTINLSATDGTVALVSGTSPLTCLTAAACAADPRVKDLVGYGNAVVHEGSGPAVGASATTSVARGVLLGDTDDNAADFTPVLPTPESSTGNGGGTDGGTGGGDDGGTVGVTGGADDGGTVGVTSGGNDGGGNTGVTVGVDEGAINGATSGDDGGTGGITSGGNDGGTVGVTGGADDGGTVGGNDGGGNAGVTVGVDEGAINGATSGDNGGTGGITSGSDDGGTVGVIGGADGGGTGGATG